jgi:hypothetical protein
MPPRRWDGVVFVNRAKRQPSQRRCGGVRGITSVSGAYNMSRIILRLKPAHRWTRDERVPIVEGDEDFDFGCDTIPVRPAVDDDWESWEVFDETKDYKTGWRRFHKIEGSA